MKFPLTSEQRSIQRAVYEFTRGEFNDDDILELLQEGRFPVKIWKKACRLGFVGLCFPEECGGQEGSLMEQIIVIEAMCRKDSSVGIALAFADMGAEIICRLGSEAQKKTYLPAIARGKLVSTAILSDIDQNDTCTAEDMTLTARGDTFRLNGRAHYVLNAELAGLYIVQCCQENGTAFALVTKEADGVTVTSMGAALGVGMLGWHEVLFENVQVDREHLMTTADAGFGKHVQQQRLLRIAAIYLGISQGAYDQALVYSKQRVQFKRKISEFQGIRHKLADMYRELAASRSLLYHAGMRLEEDRLDMADLTMVKLQAEKAARYVCYESLQIFGGSGYMVELPIEHFYRDAVMMQSLTGRSVFQKDRVARHIIGRVSD